MKIDNTFCLQGMMTTYKQNVSNKATKHENSFKYYTYSIMSQKISKFDIFQIKDIVLLYIAEANFANLSK
jgi:hypothetical protein